MVTVPAATPDKKPVLETTVASVVLLVLHAPPVVASVNAVAVVKPAHTLVGPVMPSGKAFTDTTAVAEQVFAG